MKLIDLNLLAPMKLKVSRLEALFQFQLGQVPILILCFYLAKRVTVHLALRDGDDGYCDLE